MQRGWKRGAKAPGWREIFLAAQQLTSLSRFNDEHVTPEARFLSFFPLRAPGRQIKSTDELRGVPCRSLASPVEPSFCSTRFRSTSYLQRGKSAFESKSAYARKEGKKTRDSRSKMENGKSIADLRRWLFSSVRRTRKHSLSSSLDAKGRIGSAMILDPSSTNRNESVHPLHLAAAS